jgi:nucleotide-binding universal stress UspA family protein
MKIMLATDFSDNAERAGQVASALARRAGDSLVALHVTEAACLDRQLHAYADKLRAGGVAVEERLTGGDPASSIAHHCHEPGMRLLVVGSHGRRPMARLLLGSVAQETLLLADCPVVLVPRSAHAEGLAAWANGDRSLQLTMAVDRSPGTVASAAQVRWLRDIGPVDLELVHVYDPTIAALRFGVHRNEDRQAELEAALSRDLTSFARAMLGGMPFRLRLVPSISCPGEGIADAVRDRPADLLVMGMHRLGRLLRVWMGSTAELAIRLATVPVLCAPATHGEG